MDTVGFISQSLHQVQIRLEASCEGLTQEQVLWRPLPHSNSIGFILWHVARAEDNRTASLLGKASLWESQGWYKRFGQPVDAPDPGDRAGLRAISIPALEVLTGYAEAAYRQTQEFLSSVTDDDLESVPDPSQPERTLGALLRHVVTHKNNHHGQIDYIRGLQDADWDLPQGTGVDLPPE